MSRFASNPDDVDLQRLARVKQSNSAPIPALGPELLTFFKQNIQKRQTKFAPLAECWSKLIPETLLDHTALESFHRGQLTVLVDSSSHLYDLKHLLLAGLEKQILAACRSTGLRKIALKLGRWYDESGNGPDDRKLRF